MASSTAAPEDEVVRDLIIFLVSEVALEHAKQQLDDDAAVAAAAAAAAAAAVAAMQTFAECGRDAAVQRSSIMLAESRTGKGV